MHLAMQTATQSCSIKYLVQESTKTHKTADVQNWLKECNTIIRCVQPAIHIEGSTNKRKRMRTPALTHYQLSRTLVAQVHRLWQRSEEEQPLEPNQSVTENLYATPWSNDTHNDDEPTRYMDCHGNMWNTREERDEFDRSFPPSDFETESPLTRHDSMRAGAGTTTPRMTNQERSMTNAACHHLLAQ